jgi:hypothetical protein
MKWDTVTTSPSGRPSACARRAGHLGVPNPRAAPRRAHAPRPPRGAAAPSHREHPRDSSLPITNCPGRSSAAASASGRCRTSTNTVALRFDASDSGAIRPTEPAHREPSPLSVLRSTASPRRDPPDGALGYPQRDLDHERSTTRATRSPARAHSPISTPISWSTPSNGARIVCGRGCPPRAAGPPGRLERRPQLRAPRRDHLELRQHARPCPPQRLDRLQPRIDVALVARVRRQRQSRPLQLAERHLELLAEKPVLLAEPRLLDLERAELRIDRVGLPTRRRRPRLVVPRIQPREQVARRHRDPGLEPVGHLDHTPRDLRRDIRGVQRARRAVPRPAHRHGLRHDANRAHDRQRPLLGCPARRLPRPREVQEQRHRQHDRGEPDERSEHARNPDPHRQSPFDRRAHPLWGASGHRRPVTEGVGDQRRSGES